MHAGSGGDTRFQNIEKIEVVRRFEWCLYDIDAYVCNLEIKLRWNELLCSREIVNRHFESKVCFSGASCKVLCEFLTEAKVQFSLSHAYRILTCLCLQRIELRWKSLFPKFWRRFCENQGRKNLVLFRCGNVSPIFYWSTSSKFACKSETIFVHFQVQ